MNGPQKNIILHRFGEENVLSFAQKTWQDQQSVAKSMASEALNIIYETYQINPAFFGGKSAKGVVGGLFYLLGRFNGNVKTQKEIAQSLGTTEMTIRAFYRIWLTPFQNYSQHRKEECGPLRNKGRASH